MQTFSHSIRFFAFVLVLSVSACAGVPVQEMSDARQAVEAARQAGADVRAPKELTAAEALLESAEKALAEGNFKRARADAHAAHDKAVTAQDQSLNE
jgi:hypothetical protein